MTTIIEISKFDPDYRDAGGVYQLSEWTSHHELIDGATKEVAPPLPYLNVETSYVRVAEDFAASVGVTSLKLVDIEDQRSSVPVSLIPPSVRLDLLWDISWLGLLVRSCLRSEVYARIRLGEHEMIRVVDEMYMFLISRTTLNLEKTYGLFPRDVSERITDDQFWL